MTTNTKNKTIFTRVTLDKASLDAIQQIQTMLPNYNLNDAVKMLLGLGIKNIHNISLQTDTNLDGNSFNSVTKARLLLAKQELLEKNNDDNKTTFLNPEQILKHVQNITE